MTTPIFNTLSHTDFLRLTLEAFSRQGFEVERSSDTGADAILVSKSGARIAVLCKKYRDAFIGRPVLQQFYAALHRTGCREGYLITTTDCSPEAHAFAKGKGLELFNRDRTTRLFLTAFGDGFMRTGRIPELGQKAKAVPAPAQKPVSAATYEKVAVTDRKNEQEPEKPPASKETPEPVKAPELELSSGPVGAPGPEQAAGPAQAVEQEKAPQQQAASGELPEEVETVEDLGPPASAEPASLMNTRTIFCAECNQQTRVPTDQGMIKVTCSECGSRWLYQPEMTSDGEVKTTTVVTCQTCSQQLNVPVNRGQLNVRCPKCGAKWLFTP
jgi:DNA-directed RNA polymerase subunit RPC12/RpoP